MSTSAGEEDQYQVRENEQTQGYGSGLVPAPPPPAYGYGQPPSMPYQQHVLPHSLALAVVASFFIPGLGSMLNNRVGKGVAILGCQIVAGILCLVFVGFILSPIVWIYAMITAHSDARAWNRAHGIIS